LQSFTSKKKNVIKIEKGKGNIENTTWKIKQNPSEHISIPLKKLPTKIQWDKPLVVKKNECKTYDGNKLYLVY